MTRSQCLSVMRTEYHPVHVDLCKTVTNYELVPHYHVYQVALVLTSIDCTLYNIYRKYISTKGLYMNAHDNMCRSYIIYKNDLCNMPYNITFSKCKKNLRKK